MPWFRVYSEILDDRKIKRICKRTGQSKALIIGVWTCLLALANSSPERGKLLVSTNTPFSIPEMEEETGLPSELLGQILDEFIIHGMLDGCEIVRWNERQFKSDNVAERVAKHRAKRYSNVIDQNQIRSDTESESYKDDVEEIITDDLPQLASLYEKTFGCLITAMQADKLKGWADDYGLARVTDALEKTALNNGRSMAYTERILMNKNAAPGKNGKRPAEKKELVSEDWAKYIDR
jgi:DnaD/phage-associated family protein